MNMTYIGLFGALGYGGFMGFELRLSSFKFRIQGLGFGVWGLEFWAGRAPIPETLSPYNFGRFKVQISGLRL